MTKYEDLQHAVKREPLRWLVTGAAGFIGSNLVETLLELGQEVVGMDNFATGHRRNLDEVLTRSGSAAFRFEFIEADIRDVEACRRAVTGVHIVLHQAALGSVPRSVNDPITTNAANVTGFLNMLVAAHEAGVRRFVYAASSSTYGDHPALPKVEENIGRPLSPYAVTKYVNELYADVFARTYGTPSIGLRYFNVFGKRQDAHGAYAAVIPRWIGRLLEGRACDINGDGQTSRDFCYVANVVQANLLAATVTTPEAIGQVYNIAYGGRTTLLQLHTHIQSRLAKHSPSINELAPRFAPFRTGDVRHSQADISKARNLLGYEPTHSVEQGLDEALGWYIRDFMAASMMLESAHADRDATACQVA